MMIVTDNKRASFTLMIENRGRDDAKQVLLDDAKQNDSVWTYSLIFHIPLQSVTRRGA